MAEVPTGRSVRKLLCKQGLLVMLKAYSLPSLCLMKISCVNRLATSDSILSGSDNKSPLLLGISVPATNNDQV